MRNNGLRIKNPILSSFDLDRRPHKGDINHEVFGCIGKMSHKGPQIQMFLFLFSILNLFVKHHSTCHCIEEKKMNVALISTMITPSLEYSPDTLGDIEFGYDQRTVPSRNSSSIGTKRGKEVK